MSNPELLIGLGAALAIFLTAAGTCVASVPAGIFLQHSTDRLAFVPIVQAGVLSIYGIIIGVILSNKFTGQLTESDGYKCLAAGLCVGLACLASGMGMARFIDKYMATHSTQPTSTSAGSTTSAEREPLIESSSSPLQMYVSIRFIMALIFLEAVGLYGLIVALLLSH